MKLPANFQFSQSNLQDFVDCRRRFQLKYILNVSWPAVEAEPVLENEHLIELGTRFHHLVHQFLLGIPAEDLQIPEQDEELTHWWQNFQSAIQEGGELHKIWLPSTLRYAEITLSDQLGDHRLIAKMDLVVIHPDGTAQIIDWKTTQHPPHRSWLTERLQTKVYPYLLVNTGSFLNNGQSISPNQVEMIYWFPSDSKSTICIPYNQKQYQDDKAYLDTLLDTLVHLNADDFMETSDEKRCKYCIYRSLCDRGVFAGKLSDFINSYLIDPEETVEIDFNQVDEVSF